MTTFPTSEKQVSQIPAITALMQFGYQYLPQADALKMRGENLRNVLLEGVLAEQILKLNKFTYRGVEHQFTAGDAEEAIRKLKPLPSEQHNLVNANKHVYDHLLLGTTLEKTIDDDRKSYSVKYIDWDNPSNNVYHVSAEFSIERTKGNSTRRCDIVLFANGIPFVVIENKAPTESVQSGISQLIGYQGHNNIRGLFPYVQLLISSNKNEALYGTVGTSKQYWQTWKDEEDSETDIHSRINKAIEKVELSKLFTGDFANARYLFEAQSAAGHREVTQQDRTLYALCRPERLLEIVRLFSVFDGGVRKLARYQQFFAVRKTMQRLREFDHENKRRGGVIWHTQGSGKSLTMVMLGHALALARDISNARIVIATDRDDLDRQIKNTFKDCKMEPVRATSGADLIELLKQKKSLITTVINKFDTAMRKSTFVDNDPNIFVLVDESHRTQYGSFAVKMRRILPKACYIGFTGTPLLKSEKNTLNKFGGLIHKYTVGNAVDDKAVVPLIYEGRYVEKKLSSDNTIDEWFERIARGLNDQQRAGLKKKFSQMAKLAKTQQVIYAKAFDISEHFRQTWQGTGFKAQLVAPSKAAAIQFKDFLDEIGHVTSEVVISPPDDREGNESIDMTSKKRIQTFWEDMLRKYGSEEVYNREIVDHFKNSGDPEILIVVSKLLTGFDAPRNTVLYICKALKEHNLLQAVARVNRLSENENHSKQSGYIIDYEGLLGELNNSLNAYEAFENYDQEDVKDFFVDIIAEINKLPQLHQNVLDIFKTVTNKLDHEQLEQHLADDSLRNDFYAKLREFTRTLHTSLSSDKTYELYSNAALEKYKNDWTNFSKLKSSVQTRYQDTTDTKEFEPQIQKLLDAHIIANPARSIIDQVNIHDAEALSKILADNDVTDASKADCIASATKKTIVTNMETDPAFYKAFSTMLEETIKAYREKRISETEYLFKIKDIAEKIQKGQHKDIPESIANNQDAQAFYGITLPVIEAANKTNAISSDIAAKIAEDVTNIIKLPEHLVINLWQNTDAQNKIKNAIDDYYYDHAEKVFGIVLESNQLDELQHKIMDVAKARFPQ